MEEKRCRKQNGTFFISNDKGQSLENFSQEVKGHNIEKRQETSTSTSVSEEDETTTDRNATYTLYRKGDTSKEVRAAMLHMILTTTLPTVTILGFAILFSCYLFRLNGFICRMFSDPIDIEDDLIEITDSPEQNEDRDSGQNPVEGGDTGS